MDTANSDFSDFYNMAVFVVYWWYQNVSRVQKAGGVSSIVVPSASLLPVWPLLPGASFPTVDPVAPVLPDSTESTVAAGWSQLEPRTWALRIADGKYFGLCHRHRRPQI